MDYVPRHPYVALGRSGLIKVGHTRDVKKRIPQLRKEFKAKGDELIDFEACECIEASYGVERHLITHCERTLTRHSGREWFTGGDFRALVAIAHAETQKNKDFKYRRYTDEDRAGWVASALERRQRKAMYAAQNKLKAQQRAVRNRFGRTTAARVVGSIVESILGEAPSTETRERAA